MMFEQTTLLEAKQDAPPQNVGASVIKRHRRQLHAHPSSQERGTFGPCQEGFMLQAATADVEAERGQRAEAEGVSEQLKVDGERRSRVFRNAVAAAVQRIQAELEAERDGLASRQSAAALTLLCIHRAASRSETRPVHLTAGHVHACEDSNWHGRVTCLGQCKHGHSLA